MVIFLLGLNPVVFFKHLAMRRSVNNSWVPCRECIELFLVGILVQQFGMPVQIHFSAIYAKENSTTVLPSYYSARYLTIRVRNRGTCKFLFTRSNTPYFILQSPQD